MATNSEAGIHFRNRVLIYLLQQGLNVSNPFRDRKLSELIGTFDAHTDIAGLEPWVIDVRTSQRGDISTALAEGRAAAHAAGTEWHVALMARREHSIEHSYAVLPLHLMARIFKGEIPTPDGGLEHPPVRPRSSS